MFKKIIRTRLFLEIDLMNSDKVARSIVDVGCVGAAQVAREPTQHLLFSYEG